jgi:hypothetical protein
MTPPLEREEKLQKVLTKINNGAKELCVSYRSPGRYSVRKKPLRGSRR